MKIPQLLLYKSFSRTRVIIIRGFFLSSLLLPHSDMVRNDWDPIEQNSVVSLHVHPEVELLPALVATLRTSLTEVTG